MGDEAGKGAGSEGTGAGGQGGKTEGGNAGGQGGGGSAEHMIPKSRFDTVNTELQTTKTELETLRTQLKNNVDPKKHEELTNQLETVKTDAQAKVTLARLGVSSDGYLDFLVGRYNGLDPKTRPKFEDWAKELQKSEPAFFGAGAKSQDASQSAGSGTQTPAKPPPNTDAGKAETNGGGSDPPLTDELINKMDVATYKRRRKEVSDYMAAREKR